MTTRRVLFAALWAFAPDVEAQTRPPLTPAQVVANVDAAYAAATSVTASWTETYTAVSVNVSQTSSAAMLFAKPASFRLTSNPPSTQVAVSRGQDVCEYDGSSTQAALTTHNTSPFPIILSFMSGLAGHFAFKVQVLPGNQYALVGTPLAPTSVFKEVTFYVDGQSWHVRRVLLVEPQGNLRRVELASEVLNAGVPAGSFTIHLPAGTQILGSPSNATTTTCP